MRQSLAWPSPPKPKTSQSPSFDAECLAFEKGCLCSLAVYLPDLGLTTVQINHNPKLFVDQGDQRRAFEDVLGK